MFLPSSRFYIGGTSRSTTAGTFASMMRRSVYVPNSKKCATRTLGGSLRSRNTMQCNSNSLPILGRTLCSASSTSFLRELCSKIGHCNPCSPISNVWCKRNLSRTLSRQRRLPCSSPQHSLPCNTCNHRLPYNTHLLCSTCKHQLACSINSWCSNIRRTHAGSAQTRPAGHTGNQSQTLQ